MKNKKKHKKLILNLDDLGMSPGTNSAIFKLFDEKILPIRASIISTTEESFSQALEGVFLRKDFNIGIHLSLTYGKSYTCSPCFSNNRGIFRLSYAQILLKSGSIDFLEAVEREFREQIVSVMKVTRKISHIDSHQHIHSIPAINKIVLKLAKEFHICDIRGFTEKPFMFLNRTKKYEKIFSIYSLKYFIIRSLGFFRKKRQERIIFSILLAEEPLDIKIFSQLLALSRKKCVEIILHVGNSEKNKGFTFYSESENEYHNSYKRENEYMALMNISNYVKKIKERKRLAREKEQVTS